MQSTYDYIVHIYISTLTQGGILAPEYWKYHFTLAGISMRSHTYVNRGLHNQCINLTQKFKTSLTIQ